METKVKGTNQLMDVLVVILLFLVGALVVFFLKTSADSEASNSELKNQLNISQERYQNLSDIFDEVRRTTLAISKNSYEESGINVQLNQMNMTASLSSCHGYLDTKKNLDAMYYKDIEQFTELLSRYADYTNNENCKLAANELKLANSNRAIAVSESYVASWKWCSGYFDDSVFSSDYQANYAIPAIDKTKNVNRLFDLVNTKNLAAVQACYGS